MIDIQFGKVTTHTPQDDGSIIIQTTTKHDGRVKNVITEVEVPKLVTNQSDAMAVLLDAVELINNAKSNHVHIELVADPFTFQYKRVVLKYTKKP